MATGCWSHRPHSRTWPFPPGGESTRAGGRCIPTLTFEVECGTYSSPNSP
jgi:hypothetical protein